MIFVVYTPVVFSKPTNLVGSVRKNIYCLSRIAYFLIEDFKVSDAITKTSVLGCKLKFELL